MTQDQLNREVAEATGESVHLIRKLGFSELCLPRSDYRTGQEVRLRAYRPRPSKPVQNHHLNRAA